MDVRFGKIFIMHPEAAEKLKTIRTLPERDAYVGEVSKDADMRKGDYSWWGLPDKSMLYVSGTDIDLFRKYQNEHDVPLPKGGRDDHYYNELSQRAQDFVNEQAADGREIKLIGAPFLTTVAYAAKTRLAQWGEMLQEAIADMAFGLREVFGHGNNNTPKF